MKKLFKLFDNSKANKTPNSENTEQTNQVDPMDSNVVIRVLEYNDKKYDVSTVDEELVEYRTNFNQSNAIFECLITENKSKDILSVYFYFPGKIPANKINEIALFCSLTNCSLYLGGFELHIPENSLRLRNSFYYDKTSYFSDNVLASSINMLSDIINGCFPGIMSILYADADPIDVYNQFINRVDANLN